MSGVPRKASFSATTSMCVSAAGPGRSRDAHGPLAQVAHGLLLLLGADAVEEQGRRAIGQDDPQGGPHHERRGPDEKALRPLRGGGLRGAQHGPEPRAAMARITASTSLTSCARTASSSVRSRSQAASTRTRPSRATSRCCTAPGRRCSKATCLWSRSETRSCISSRSTFGRRRQRESRS